MELQGSRTLNTSLETLCQDAFERPEKHLERLYDLSIRDRWTVQELDWSGLDLQIIPEPLRRSIADVVAQLQYGEMTALLCANRVLPHLKTQSGQLYCATQISDEARHVRFFSNIMGRLGCEGKVRATIRQMMAEVYEAPTPAAMMVGMHIMIEGVAHSFFHSGVHLFDGIQDDNPLIKSVKRVIVDWLPKLIARDESRHISFGMHYLKEAIPTLSRKERDDIEERIVKWGEDVYEMAIDPDAIEDIGLDGFKISKECIEDLNLRLGQIGLTTRIPEAP